MSFSVPRWALGPALALGLLVGDARALEPPVREDRLPVPGRSVASNDQSSAIAQNPANLAFLPATELRWTWIRTGQGSPVPLRGHASDLGFPLFLGLSTGLRLDWVRPPESAPYPFTMPGPDGNEQQSYRWLTWALALKLTDGFSLGGSIQHASSSNPLLDDLTSYSLAVSMRPSPYYGLAIVGRDLSSPTSPAGAHLPASVDVGLAIRPTGRRHFELGLEARHYRDWYPNPEDPSSRKRGQWVPRATVGIDFPYVGRLRGEVSASDPTTKGRKVYTAMAGLELGLGTSSYEGGAIFGTGVGGQRGAGFYTGLALHGYRAPGLPEPAYALTLRIEETPGTRGHVALLRRLWNLAGDDRLEAVVLELKAEPASSLARAEELGDAIRLLRANGKKVICHFEDAKGRSLFVCSQADRIVVNPAGGLRFAGLRTQYMYYADLLSKLGIRAQFVRVGDHKTAPEAFTRSGPTEVARSDHLELLQQYQTGFLDTVGGGRRIPVQELHERIARGPFIAQEAIDAGLADGLAFDDEIDKVVEEVVGRRIRVLDEPPLPSAPTRFGSRRKIALVYIDGDIIDGRSRTVPLFGNRLVGSYTIAKTLEQVRQDPQYAAVVLRIESPGGSSLASDVMWREALLTAQKKPLIVSMGSVAASGGYYVASAAPLVYANPLTLTGSIGIFYGKADVSELMSKIGVSVETYKTTPRADAESLYRPFTPEEMKELERKVWQFYEVFLDRVAQGREMTKEEVDAVGRGKVWTGRQALEHGLVDRLGGLRQALDAARELGQLPSDTPIEELPVIRPDWLNVAMKLALGSENVPDASALLPFPLVEIAKGLSPFTIYEPDQALMRLELVPLESP